MPDTEEPTTTVSAGVPFLSTRSLGEGTDAPAAPAGHFVVKVTLRDDTRRLLVPIEGTTLQTFKERLARTFNLSDTTFNLKYKDGEGDVLTLSDESELKGLVAGLEKAEESKKTLRVKIVPPPMSKSEVLAEYADPNLPLLTQEGDNFSEAHLQLCRHLFGNFPDHSILEMLRDIRYYICAREGLVPEVRTHIARHKSLITPKNLLNEQKEPEKAVEAAGASKPLKPSPIKEENVAEVTKNLESLTTDTPTPSSAGGPPQHAQKWNVSEVADWLITKELGDFAELFKENEIDGSLLWELDHEVLKSMGISAAGKRMKVLKAVAELKEA
eukprot:Clim_evm10s128 gene=Clim_evmTU10s128